MDDLREKNIPSGPINPAVCLIMQMVGQEVVIKVDPARCQQLCLVAVGLHCGFFYFSRTP